MRNVQAARTAKRCAATHARGLETCWAAGRDCAASRRGACPAEAAEGSRHHAGGKTRARPHRNGKPALPPVPKVWT